MKIIVAQDYQIMSQIAADMLVNLLKKKNDAVLGLATGSTPIGLYQNLISAYKNGVISFKKVKTVNLDEYVGLKKTNKQSYAYFMRKNLFDEVDVDLNSTFIPNGMAADLETECLNYNALLENLRQDVQILGLGSNGHIGFNEPFTAFDSKTHIVKLSPTTIEDNSRLFDVGEAVPTHAITMGISQIMRAKQIILLASGQNKAKAVRDAVNGGVNSSCPASVLGLHANCTFILDKQSASML